MLLFIISLLAKGCFCNQQITFPDEKSMVNESVQSRLGWTVLGNLEAYKNALEKLIVGNFAIQTEIISPAVPTITTAINRLSTFPPLPSVPLPFPTPNPGILQRLNLSFPRDNFLPAGVFPGVPQVEAAAQVTIVNPSSCRCTAKELCLIVGATTKIVTKPPSGIVCPAGQTYCCTNGNVQTGCGTTTIIPGVIPQEDQAYLGEHPWSAIILTSGNAYVGGGVLIDSTHILTVTHRVIQFGNGADLKVRLGEWDITNENEPVRHIEVSVSKIVNHPNFEAATLKNDISILTLATPVPLTSAAYPQINTICLPPVTSIFTGLRCRVAGWGKDQFNGNYQTIMKEVQVPVLSSTECQTLLRNTKLGSSFVLDSNSFICAGGEANKDACTGDGGNALECLMNGKYYLAGITAGGIECGNARVPGLYVNIVNFLTWISSQIGGENVGGLLNPRKLSK